MIYHSLADIPAPSEQIWAYTPQHNVQNLSVYLVSQDFQAAQSLKQCNEILFNDIQI